MNSSSANRSAAVSPNGWNVAIVIYALGSIALGGVVVAGLHACTRAAAGTAPLYSDARRNRRRLPLVTAATSSALQPRRSRPATSAG
jgi:hypothetical protein